jgi:hypothetical protein
MGNNNTGTKKRKHLKVYICRPVSLGKEFIMKEWIRIYQYVSSLHRNGHNQDDINIALKKNTQIEE